MNKKEKYVPTTIDVAYELFETVCESQHPSPLVHGSVHKSSDRHLESHAYNIIIMYYYQFSARYHFAPYYIQKI